MENKQSSKSDLLIFIIFGAILTPIGFLAIMEWNWIPADLTFITEEYMPLENLLVLFDGLAFAIGVAFFVKGLPKLRNVKPELQSRVFILFVALTWNLVNWLIHNRLHLAFGFDMSGLLILEYGFHVTMQISGLFAAYAIYTMITRKDEFAEKEAVLIPKKLLIVLGVVLVPLFVFVGKFILLPDNPSLPDPGALTPLFIILGFIDAITFTIGLYFIVFYLRNLRNVTTTTQNRFFLMFLAVAWTLVSWYPHTRLHLNIGFVPAGLFAIDLFFHLTIQIAGIIGVYSVATLMNNEFRS
jgi:hypothetical protein